MSPRGLPRGQTLWALLQRVISVLARKDSLTRGGPDADKGRARRTNHERGESCHHELVKVFGPDFWRPRGRAVLYAGDLSPEAALELLAASGAAIDEVYSSHAAAPRLPTAMLGPGGLQSVVSQLRPARRGVGGVLDALGAREPITIITTIITTTITTTIVIITTIITIITITTIFTNTRSRAASAPRSSPTWSPERRRRWRRCSAARRSAHVCVCVYIYIYIYIHNIIIILLHSIV